MRVAVLALQGAFVEHEQVLAALGADFLELRQRRDLDQPFDALILPGGESTVQGKLLRDLDMLKPLTGRIRDGLPVLGTCAGLILLAENILPQEPGHFKTLPVTVRRNAYGRQLGSFYTEEAFGGLAHNTRQRLEAIGAKHSKIKLRARPRDTNFAPGTVLLREWGDREHKVAVTAEGLFEYEGSTFKSLTAVARQITGTHWSGPLFFGLTGKAGAL